MVKRCGRCGAAVLGGREGWALKADGHFCDLPDSGLEIQRVSLSTRSRLGRLC